MTSKPQLGFGFGAESAVYDHNRTTLEEWMWRPEGLGLSFMDNESALMLYGRIYEICHNGGMYCETPEQAGRSLGFGPQTIQKAAALLEDWGYIRRIGLQVIVDPLGDSYILASDDPSATVDGMCAWGINLAAVSDAIEKCRPVSDAGGPGVYCDPNYGKLRNAGRR